MNQIFRREVKINNQRSSRIRRFKETKKNGRRRIRYGRLHHQ